VLCGPCLTGQSTANFTDCLISENQANRGGAGITVISGSHLTLVNSNVTKNEAGGMIENTPLYSTDVDSK
jgi:hypothetical protein